MSKKIQSWLTFAVRVRNHIRDYVIKQYGEEGQDPATEYTAEDCIKQAQRYLTRFGKQSRQGEELLDLYKAAHWIQIAYDKIASVRLQTIDEEAINAERNFAGEPPSITELKGNKSGNMVDWKPRDAIIDALRAIDSGEFPNLDAVIVCMRSNKGGGETMTSFRQACPDYHTSVGLLHAVAHKIDAS